MSRLARAAQGQADRGERAEQHRLPARRLGAQGERHQPRPGASSPTARTRPPLSTMTAEPSRSRSWPVSSRTPSGGGLPEPFASLAEQNLGAVPLTDLNQGATTDFPIEGYVVTKAWAAKNPHTLQAVPRRAFRGAGDRRHRPHRGRAGVRGHQRRAKRPGAGTHRRGDGARHLPHRHRRDRLQRVANVMFQFGLLSSQGEQHAVSSFFNMLLPVVGSSTSPPTSARLAAGLES
jgi:hypothetical protein